MLVFLLDCLHFSKLLKLHQTEGKISSNLLNRQQFSKKTRIIPVCPLAINHGNSQRLNSESL